MHRCLEVQEILSLIFENTRDDDKFIYYSNSRRSKSLVALSRTCKAFSDPALDILWYYHASLGPLVRCLPQDAWAVRKRNTHSYRGGMVYSWGGDLQIIRDLLPEDFERVYYYSYRIKSLGFVPLMDSNWDFSDPVILRMLWSCKPKPGPLLPSLLELNIEATAFQDFALYPRLVVGSVLKKLHIYCCENMTRGFLGGRSIASNMASIIHRASSAITSFKIMYEDAYAQDPGIDCDIEAEVMLMYRELRSLQNFSARATYITSGFLAHLASLPRLNNMRICVHEDELSQFNEANPPEGIVFSGLVELYIETDSLKHAQGLLNRPGYSQLQKLKVEQNDTHDVWDVGPFLAILAPYTKLEEIKIRESEYWRFSQTNESSKVTERAITPALPLSNITNFEISLGGTVSLSDDFLGRIAESWPRLEILNFYERTVGTPPEATIRGVLNLAKSCRHLQQLSLRFNALNEFFEGLLPLEDIISCETLHSFNICTSPVETCDEVVTFIEAMFPNLRELNYGWFYNNAYGDAMNIDAELPQEEFISFEWWDRITQVWNIRRRSRLNDESV